MIRRPTRRRRHAGPTPRSGAVLGSWPSRWPQRRCSASPAPAPDPVSSAKQSRVASSPADPARTSSNPRRCWRKRLGRSPARRAALEVLSRPDIRPTVGYVSEDGDLLVRWELRGLRDRDVYRCRHPVALTWAPAPYGGTGSGPGRCGPGCSPTANVKSSRRARGSSLSDSTCSGREFADQAPGLVVGDQGRLLTAERVRRTRGSSSRGRDARVLSATEPGPLPARPRGEQHPASARQVLWAGSWHPETSILWRPSWHISGTWSVDGGRTWNQFMDTWDAAPLRSGGATLAVTNGVRSSFGELAGEGLYREGYVEWAPWDRQPVVQLPKSTDGYRWWRTAPDGTLVGIGRAGGVYVSEGTNWHQVSRRGTGRCGAVELVGRLLVCGPLRAEKGSEDNRVMRVSDDLGRTWTGVVLNRVVPRAKARLMAALRSRIAALAAALALGSVGLQQRHEPIRPSEPAAMPSPSAPAESATARAPDPLAAKPAREDARHGRHLRRRPRSERHHPGRDHQPLRDAQRLPHLRPTVGSP